MVQKEGTMFGTKLSSLVTLIAAAGMIASACAPQAAPAATQAPVAAATTAPATASPAPTAAAVAARPAIYQGTLQDKDEVSTDELKQILLQKSAMVLDARPFKEFAISHIPGAVNVSQKPGVPIATYVSDVAEVGRIAPDKNAALVLYCNGPFCPKSKALAESLTGAGYTNVRRYQLGIPTWRALVGYTQAELDGVRYALDGDKTTVLFDARSAEEFKAGALPGARNLVVADVNAAKTDGRLPTEDHNTRIIVVGKDGAQARALAEEIAKAAFDNVSFYAAGWETINR
jgi:rhodanese-related sulfurtransferase